MGYYAEGYFPTLKERIRISPYLDVDRLVVDGNLRPSICRPAPRIISRTTLWNSPEYTCNTAIMIMNCDYSRKVLTTLSYTTSQSRRSAWSIMRNHSKS